MRVAGFLHVRCWLFAKHVAQLLAKRVAQLLAKRVVPLIEYYFNS